jgi:parallel beta-helix repeat protein
MLVFISEHYSQAFHVVGNISAGPIPIRYVSITFTEEGNPSNTFAAITDSSGNYQIDIVTIIKEEPIIPKTIELAQNYPNPFSTETEIPYKLNKQSDASIKIYNILGQEIKTFNIGFQVNGTYSVRWDGRNNHGNKVNVGIYFYRLQTNSEAQVKKMLFISGGTDINLPFYRKVTFDNIQEINEENTMQFMERKYTIKIINSDSTSPRVTTRLYHDFKIHSDTVINFSVHEAYAIKDIYGTITKNESPFYINGPARIPKYETLIIEPGVTILFKSGDIENHNECDFDWSDSTVDLGFLRVDGKLIAEGLKSDSIIFTRDSSIDNYYWGCIYFSETADSNSIISFSKVEYASTINSIDPRVHGDGITCWFSNIIIQNSLIQNNKEFGIHLQNSETLVKNNTIKNCLFGIGTWAFDEFAYLQPIFRNNIIIRNSARGIIIFKPNPLIENNVIANNEDIGIMVGYRLGKSLKFVNNIIYGNKNQQVKIDSLYVPTDIIYSDIENGWSGEGNINADPKFVNPASEDFHLLPDSPCKNTGSPLIQYNDHDGSRNDMGAYGGPYGDW